ncbi:carboxypeptidase regulatory-like domain-containing protein [Porphyrobacter sp. SLTP]|uniref:carboxypeptidase regulatory-like domain-containing protein n=1 Tax=Porphyrobacter sp. SLTP TaxID=2683266 RepID=UPI0014124F60|nr:carboxypeptidase regulatory-like domain-containing protein [Porphyrobacter sp. SLTP]NBB25926.1 carboxypeptidase regulatory-like domain-containing protein [Porphyrobacter sp. SLTP]
MLSLPTLTAVLIAVGSLGAAIALLWRRRDWRAGVLAALTLVSGLLLYLALFPPRLPVGGETLVIATAEAPLTAKAQPGERLIALPEGPAINGAERVPDLATALRRHEQAQRVRIIGRGLTPRDRDAAAGVPITFTPMPVPRGLIRLDPPADTPAGAIFTVAGEANGMAGGAAELLDPAGRRVDRRVIGTDGAFAMGGTARAPGLATFTLRLRGRDGSIVSDTPVPLRTIAQPPLRALLIGAPSPEAKYLRRWAEDSGIDMQSRLEAGGGVNLGGESVSLNAATLREVDVVIIADQSLGSGSRAVLAQAVAGGLGVVVRMTGPASAAARGNWRALGLAVEGGSEAVPVALPPLAPDADTLTALRGPGSEDAPASINTVDDPAPDLGRWTVRAGAAFVPAVTDADGGVLSGWQQRGQGRVALWTVANSFALVLNGQADRYYQWWSETVSAVSRPDGTFRPEVPALPEVGERMAICGVSGAARVVGPDSTEVALAIDPLAGAQGCAAYWPASAGVHRIVQPGRDGPQEFAFIVLPKGALTVAKAKEMGATTQRWAAEQNAPATRDTPERRGPAWPYVLGWLLVSGLLWFGERRWLARPAS